MLFSFLTRFLAPGVLPITAHLGQAPHKGGTFFRLQELVGVHKRVGKSVRGANVTDAFHGCKKVEETFWFCNLFTSKTQLVKRDAMF